MVAVSAEPRGKDFFALKKAWAHSGRPRRCTATVQKWAFEFSRRRSHRVDAIREILSLARDAQSSVKHALAKRFAKLQKPAAALCSLPIVLAALEDLVAPQRLDDKAAARSSETGSIAGGTGHCYAASNGGSIVGMDVTDHAPPSNEVSFAGGTGHCYAASNGGSIVGMDVTDHAPPSNEVSFAGGTGHCYAASNGGSIVGMDVTDHAPPSNGVSFAACTTGRSTANSAADSSGSTAFISLRLLEGEELLQSSRIPSSIVEVGDGVTRKWSFQDLASNTEANVAKIIGGGCFGEIIYYYTTVECKVQRQMILYGCRWTAGSCVLE